ncbi:MAG: hypothetical protein J5953_07725 [Prevotella sp.]|nr:hypothetical protein [Prevotella sp.]
MKKTYQIPILNQDIVFGECQLLVGTTIPVVPGEEGSQSEAESKMASFEDTDKALRSYERDPLGYLPDAFQDIWGEE